jgi:hypothetical protein
MKTAANIVLGLLVFALVIALALFSWVAFCVVFGLVCAGNQYAIAGVVIAVILLEAIRK